MMLKAKALVDRIHKRLFVYQNCRQEIRFGGSALQSRGTCGKRRKHHEGYLYRFCCNFPSRLGR